MILLLIFLDQLSKYFAYDAKPSFSVIGNILRIDYIQNTGTIFGLLENSNIVFIVLAFVLCIVICMYMKYKIEKKSITYKCLKLILAGGIGNLIDRIFRGFVVDFISLKFVGVFNFADSYIVIGVIILLFMELKEFIKDGKASRKSNTNS